MKTYITPEEYRSLGGKAPDDISPKNLEHWISLATILVDKMTTHKIRGLEHLTPYQQSLVKQATVAQVDFLIDLDSTVGLDAGNVSSWSITDISINTGGDSEGAQAAWLRQENCSSTAYTYLNASGLTWRGV